MVLTVHLLPIVVGRRPNIPRIYLGVMCAKKESEDFHVFPRMTENGIFSASAFRIEQLVVCARSDSLCHRKCFNVITQIKRVSIVKWHMHYATKANIFHQWHGMSARTIILYRVRAYVVFSRLCDNYKIKLSTRNTNKFTW